MLHFRTVSYIPAPNANTSQGRIDIIIKRFAVKGTTALSTSGNSRNVIDALLVAKAKGLKTIGMTGETGGKMKDLCDVLINVPETRTAYVQELHLPVCHALCLMIEKELFG